MYQRTVKILKVSNTALKLEVIIDMLEGRV